MCLLNLTLLNLHQVSVILSVSQLPYNLRSPYLVHTFIKKGTCQLGMCHLTLSSFSGSTYIVKFTPSYHD
jgi:hypothetical protein